MNFRISGQKINIAKEAKYLGLKLDQHLTFKLHMQTIKLKLNRANGLLAKIRYHVNSEFLKTIYSAIFEPHLRYSCQLWGQTQTQVMSNIEKIQNKALRIISIEGPCESSAPLFKESKILKLKGIVTLKNLRFVYVQINKIYQNNFILFLHSKGNNIDTIREETP